MSALNTFTVPHTPPAPGFWDEVHPVTVVGGGPVGLTTALGLVRRGIPTVLVEARDTVSVGSRAICTSRHSLEILDRLGVGDRVQERSLVWDRGKSFYRDQQILEFVMPNDEKFVRPPMVNISQADIEQYLWEALLAEPGATVLTSCEVTGVQEVPASAAAHGTDRTVELTVSAPEGERTLRTAWVAAADGARSAVRRAMDLRLEGTSYEGRYVIADITWVNDWPTERFVWFDPESNRGSTIIMHKQPDDVWRVDYQLRDEDDPEHEQRPEVIRARITEHLEWLGETDAQWEMVWSSLYSARALALEDFRHGNVVFVGDAAHLVPIFGVRGMNSGLEDAATASWQLAAVVLGAARPALLDAYAAERRYAWEQNISNATLSTLFMTPGTFGYKASREAVLPLIGARPALRHLVDPRQSSATHARGSLINWGTPGSRAGIHPGDPVADTHLPDLGTTLYRATDRGFTVIGTRGTAEPARRTADAFAAQFPQEGARVLELSAADRALLGIEGEHVVVLRPEGLVLAVLAPGETTEPTGIAAGVAAGRTGSRYVTERRTRTPDPEAETVETVWRGISEGLDAADDDGSRVAFLAKAVLLLATNHPEPAAVREALDLAAQQR
ncbi:FAD-dependent monooxygenase [Kocuria sp. M1R5S2]|uniref:FAD-dependent monooxygenase n=1 Tax=Kocuria rhizosphaerae TaxID=3376285 RepID=UPI00379D797C